MSSKQESGIKYDPADFDMMVLIQKTAPDIGDSISEGNVMVFMNGKQVPFFSIEIKVSGNFPYPIIKLNGDINDEN